jgi:hypothetical protein
MMWLLACTGGAGLYGTDEDPPQATISEATQIFDDGTETCVPEVLTESSLLATGVTVGDVLALLRAEVVSPTWFDGRAVDISVSLVHAGAPVTRDAGCEVRTELEVSVVSDDGAVQQAFVTEGSLSAREAGGSIEIDSADWMGTLSSAEFLAEPCPQGESWDVIVRQGSGSSGSIWHACEGVILGTGEPGTGPDTGTDTRGTPDTDTGTGTTTGTLPGTLPPLPLAGPPDDTGDTAAPVYVDPPLEVISW